MTRRFIKTLMTVTVIFLSALSARAEDPVQPGWFAWGADLSTSIDLGSTDMSTINFDAYFGYRNKGIIKLLGFGAGINMMMSNSCSAFPLYAIFRTSFTTRPMPCFMDLRIGCAVNNSFGNDDKAALYISPGVGFNLARGKSFSSYLALSYVYNGMKHERVVDEPRIDGLHMANIRIGIIF